MSIPKEHKIIAVAQLITVAGLTGLWLSFYMSPPVQPDPEGYRFMYDYTNPFADGILALILCLAAYGLLKAMRYGRPLSQISSLYLISLSVIDIGIPTGEGKFAVSIIDITANGALNLWCVVLGLYAVLKLRKKNSDDRKQPPRPEAG